MQFTFLCSSNERKIYEESIGLETIISINGLESKCIIKSVDDYGNVIVETDSEISKILQEKLGHK